jgi:hypothetical protein
MNYSTIADRENIIKDNIVHDDTENAIYNIISFLLYPDNKDRESLSQYIDEIIEENKLLIDYYNYPGAWTKIFGTNFTSDKIIGTSDFKNTMLNLLQANILLKRKSKGISEVYADIAIGDINTIKTQSNIQTDSTKDSNTKDSNALLPPNINQKDYYFPPNHTTEQIISQNLNLRKLVEEYNLERLKEEIRILTELQAYKTALNAHNKSNQTGGNIYHNIKYIISNKKLFQLGGTWQQDLETIIKSKYSDYTIKDIAEVIIQKKEEEEKIDSTIKQIETQLKNSDNKTGGGRIKSAKDFYTQLDILLNKINNNAIPLNETISSEQQTEINQIITNIQKTAAELNINVDNLLYDLIAKYKDLFNIVDAVKQAKTTGKLDVSSEINSRKKLYTKLADNIMDTIGKLKARARNPMQTEKIPLPMINTNAPRFNKKYIVIKSNK